MPLSLAERQSFLAEPHIAALAVDGQAGRAPLLIPIWYAYEPGGDVWIITQPGSRKAELIRAAGRFSLMVERTQPSYRYVSVEGPVSRSASTTPEEIDALCARYLTGYDPQDADAVRAIYSTEDVTIRMTPEHWLSSDMGSF
ncbi:pyridoxamine 5'-phosphate oxidase family protein [Streptomyces sp. TRM 70351]|uniref:pyridoxamine 5'-phosphate oxidase family protein n=1 Tax=Streptomyces sp. TRM 70351 TaxID=3116552 RepID=UPI002E7C4DCD|nr:pyridoxamine 5'-phosphate oxidase family protein [Streptomyces sp. TRM 70351]MEE1929551.1 pyridoxamine 5'-phosphate oxidase family protein [Streptomyces sp. TRM 70351]